VGCLEILRSPTSRTRQLSSGSIARDQIARMKQEKRECREADHAREVGTPTSMSIIVVSAAPRFGGRGLVRIFPVLAPGLSSNATRSVLEPPPRSRWSGEGQDRIAKSCYQARRRDTPALGPKAGSSAPSNTERTTAVGGTAVSSAACTANRRRTSRLSRALKSEITRPRVSESRMFIES